jgi:hypothetical protein
LKLKLLKLIKGISSKMKFMDGLILQTVHQTNQYDGYVKIINGFAAGATTTTTAANFTAANAG